MAANEVLLETRVEFRAGVPMNTAVDVTVPIDLPNASGYEVSLANPSKNAGVTVHIKSHAPGDQGDGAGGLDHFPEVAVFSVEEGGEHAEEIEWDLSRGGRVTCTLDAPLGGGQGFAADLRVTRL